MSRHVKFSQFPPGADRLHYVNAEDVRIVLSRLPVELWQRLRTVHFNDRSRGARVFGTSIVGVVRSPCVPSRRA